MGLYMEMGASCTWSQGCMWSRAFKEGLSVSEAVGLSPDPIWPASLREESIWTQRDQQSR